MIGHIGKHGGSAQYPLQNDVKIYVVIIALFLSFADD